MVGRPCKVMSKTFDVIPCGKREQWSRRDQARCDTFVPQASEDVDEQGRLEYWRALVLGSKQMLLT